VVGGRGRHRLAPPGARAPIGRKPPLRDEHEFARGQISMLPEHRIDPCPVGPAPSRHRLHRNHDLMASLRRTDHDVNFPQCAGRAAWQHRRGFDSGVGRHMTMQYLDNLLEEVRPLRHHAMVERIGREGPDLAAERHDRQRCAARSPADVGGRLKRT
jgi:hypothetical protein